MVRVANQPIMAGACRNEKGKKQRGMGGSEPEP